MTMYRSADGASTSGSSSRPTPAIPSVKDDYTNEDFNDVIAVSF